MSMTIAGLMLAAAFQGQATRVEVEPAEVRLRLGERTTLTARAVDANGATMNGARLNWFVPGALNWRGM